MTLSVESPCVRICAIDQGICTGCGRDLQQISAWRSATDEEKERIVKESALRLAKYKSATCTP